MEQSELEKNTEQTASEETAAQETPAEEKPAEAPAEEETAPEQEPAPEEEEHIDGKALFNDILDILETMVISVFVILLIFGYFMRPVTVEGRSMVPTLHDKDRLVMYRLFYQPKVGDVVVVNDQEGHIFDSDGNVIPSGYSLNEHIIKRVIAVSGQTIRVDASAGEVYVDDVRLDEPYINERTLTDDRAFVYPITIPEGYIFVMGDNRNHSTDSRSGSVGLVKTEDVMGKAYFRYLPAEPGEYDTYEKGTIGFVK